MVDPHPYAVGTLKETYKKFPHIRDTVPAMGYSPQQVLLLLTLYGMGLCGCSASMWDAGRLLACLQHGWHVHACTCTCMVSLHAQACTSDA